MSIAIFFHPDCLQHDTGLGHPESAARLSVILDGLKNCGFSQELDFIPATLGTRTQVLLAHTPEHYDHIAQSIPAEGDYTYLDPDTIMSHGSFQAALRAVGASCEAIDKVVTGKYDSAFCAIRPPGHHATSNRAMGFCLFNNVAIAARHAIQMHKLERVAIVDLDVHHGIGTEEIFKRDARVLYISTHEWPHYPGTGSAAEKGVGNIVNIPLSAATDGTEYRTVFSENVMSTLRNFQPQLILVSAGFDAHRDDPLASIKLVEDDYRWIGTQLRSVANEYCGGKTISFLEGGYNLRALAASAVSYVSAFAETEQT